MSHMLASSFDDGTYIFMKQVVEMLLSNLAGAKRIEVVLSAYDLLEDK